MNERPCTRRFLLAAGSAMFISAPLLAKAAATTASSTPNRIVAGIELPATPLALAAEEMARANCPMFLFNHCMRTFLFATMAAGRDPPRYDAEALFIAAALHDLGLIQRFESANDPFEMDSADAAKAFLHDQGVEGDRASLIWDAIAMHALAISSRKAPEVRLLAMGAGMDVFGGGVRSLDPGKVDEVLKAFPRTGFKAGFEGLILDYCRHKPGQQAGTWTDAFCRSHLPDVQFPTFERAFARSPFGD